MNFRGSQGISEIPGAFQEVPVRLRSVSKGFKGFQRASRVFRGFQEILGTLQGCQERTRGFGSVQGDLRNDTGDISNGYQKISGTFQSVSGDLSGIKGVSVGFRRILRDFGGVQGD